MSPILRRARAVALFLPLLAFVAAPSTPQPEPPFHPHFPKILTCKVSDALTLTVRYQTVTFNQEAAAKFAPGKAWHLAGAEFESTADLRIGGQDVKAGKYALSARKTANGEWELVLHSGNGFSTKIGDDAHVLQSRFVKESPRYEHLNIDVQPGGDKQHTKLYLEVHFDTLLAAAEIELPE